MLEAVGESGKRLRYLYDFGDGWEHTIKMGRMTDPDPDVLYPQLLEATGRCPPEDVGGPWGYDDFLLALGDKSHDRHKELSEWIGGAFDPGKAPVERLKADVASLAKRWARKPRAKAKTRE